MLLKLVSHEDPEIYFVMPMAALEKFLKGEGVYSPQVVEDMMGRLRRHETVDTDDFKITEHLIPGRVWVLTQNGGSHEVVESLALINRIFSDRYRGSEVVRTQYGETYYRYRINHAGFWHNYEAEQVSLLCTDNLAIPGCCSVMERGASGTTCAKPSTETSGSASSPQALDG